MSGAGENKAASKLLQVLVADSTLLTGGLIADALRRDRKLSITNATGNSVTATVPGSSRGPSHRSRPPLM